MSCQNSKINQSSWIRTCLMWHNCQLAGEMGMHPFTISDQTVRRQCSGKIVAIGAYLVFPIHGMSFFMLFFSRGRNFGNRDRTPQMFLKFHYNWPIQCYELYTNQWQPFLSEVKLQVEFGVGAPNFLLVCLMLQNFILGNQRNLYVLISYKVIVWPSL